MKLRRLTPPWLPRSMHARARRISEERWERAKQVRALWSICCDRNWHGGNGEHGTSLQHGDTEARRSFFEATRQALNAWIRGLEVFFSFNSVSPCLRVRACSVLSVPSADR